MGQECLRFHSCLAELTGLKKAKTVWEDDFHIRARTFFALLRAALVCSSGLMFQGNQECPPAMPGMRTLILKLQREQFISWSFDISFYPLQL